MKFKNETGSDKMVQIRETTAVSKWLTIKPGQIVDLEPGIGIKNGLTRVVEEPEVKAVESSAGPAKVETKKKVDPEKEKLVQVKGVDDEIADAILMRFGSISNAIEAGTKGLMKVPAVGMARAKRILSSLS